MIYLYYYPNQHYDALMPVEYVSENNNSAINQLKQNIVYQLKLFKTQDYTYSANDSLLTKTQKIDNFKKKYSEKEKIIDQIKTYHKNKDTSRDYDYRV
jgi:hypothetical protein